jgi:hypothetical protein
MNMDKYQDLVTIVDKIREEAPTSYRRYMPDASEIEKLNQARARAFIHLFLKVRFGITDFLLRESYITDDVGDGGIDGYYIDEDLKILYFIQSKFRATSSNFEKKEITFEELLSMDIQRISEGESLSETGQKYNEKILKFITALQNISDLPKYERKVILLANVKNTLQLKLSKLTGGYKVDIYNYERCYAELVFPLVSGTYYNISELKITINVDRNSAGHRIQYYPSTKHFECTVNALFVPTLEIAKILSKYKNSILKFNPRSYLDLSSGSINSKIARSITDITTNEFALFNNGITMLSDDTVYSDKVGKKNKADVIITNPQIINGGQTAYTLSVLYDEYVKNNATSVFEGKEVLLKIISFNDESSPTEDINGKKLKLIEDISIATNQQSPVTEADRRANDKVQIELQKAIFEEFGLYYERKRGEFGDGIKQGYINRSKIIDRDQLLRVCLAVQNKPSESRGGSIQNYYIKKNFDNILPDISDYRKYIFGYKTFEKIPSLGHVSHNISHFAKYAITCILGNIFDEKIKTENFDEKIMEELISVTSKWDAFESYVRNQKSNNPYFREIYDQVTGQKLIETNWSGYYKGGTLINDLRRYFF